MPFQTNGKRNYKKEREWELKKKPSRLKDRAERNRARRIVEKDTGNLPTSVHVDHKKPIVNGGGNSRSNLRPVSARVNLHKEGMRKRRSR